MAATIVDGHLEVCDHPDPTPGTGELLVDVRAAGLNSADQMQVHGLYPAPPGSPSDIPGMELAGIVASIGPGVTRFREGDRVMALVGGGAQAERCVVHERMAMPVPDGLSWPEAGGFPEAFVTAHDCLFSQCELAMGEHALVHGAAGGVGTAGVQLAAATGARVTATVRHDDLRVAVAALAEPGRIHAIAPDGFEQHGPYDVVLEVIGAPNLGGDLAALATGGRIGIIGVGAGATTEINLLALMGHRARIHGSTLRARPLEEKALATRRVEREVLPLLADGRVTVPIAATFPLDRAPEAYERFAAGAKLGKVVLVV
jgi:NADPH:quinone reductase-like Zn-dependent oxidoreductase